MFVALQEKATAWYRKRRLARLRAMQLEGNSSADNHVKKERIIQKQSGEAHPEEYVMTSAIAVDSDFIPENSAHRRFGLAQIRETRSSSKLITFPKLKKEGEPFTTRNQLRATILRSPMNILLLAIPAGFVVKYANQIPIVTFSVNLVACIPLSGILGNALDDLIKHIGGLIGTLLYMTFGNVVVIITSVFLLKSRQIATLKTSLVGNILTLICVNTGMAFFVGGLDRREQFFSIPAAQIIGLSLNIGLAALLLPLAVSWSGPDITPAITDASRGIAIIVLVLYLYFLFFQLNSHRMMMEERGKKVARTPKKNEITPFGIWKALAAAGATSAAQGRSRVIDSGQDELFGWTEPEEEESPPLMSKKTCVVTLLVGTTIIAFNTQFLTDSISGLVESAGAVSQSFVGIVLLPILSNDLVAIESGMSDRMDVAILASLGKSCQMVLLVIPSLVLLGWIMGVSDMNYDFDRFEVAVLFVAVYLVQNTIYAGRSNWLTGVLYCALYLIIAVSSWFRD